MLSCAAALEPVWNNAPAVFGSSFIDDKTLGSYTNLYVVMLSCAAMLYCFDPDRLKSSFPVHAIYRIGVTIFTTLRAPILVTCRIIWSSFSLPRLNRFFYFDVTHFKLVKFRRTILKHFLSRMWLLRWNQGDRMDRFRNQTFVCRIKGEDMKCIDPHGATSEGSF